MGQQNEARRRFVRVKLRHKGVEDLLRREAFVGAWKIGAIAPVLKSPEEKDFDAKLSRVFGDGENIRLFDGFRIDPLGALNGGERRNAVTQPRGALEFHQLRRLSHLVRKTLAHSPALAGQKIAGLAHELRIVRLADFSGARGRAALDLIEQTRARAIGEITVRAGPQQKGALQGVQGAIDSPDAREGAEIGALPVAGAAMLGDLRSGVIAGQQNIGKRFVVAHQDVEPRLQLLDEIRLEKKRLRLGFGRDEDHRGGQRDHPGDARRVAYGPHIARDPFADAFCLADIEHFMIGANHPVDARPNRSMFPEPADNGGAMAKRGGGLFRVVLGWIESVAGVRFVNGVGRSARSPCRDVLGVLSRSGQTCLVFLHA